MSIPHPIPYQGSKRHLADKIALFIPASTQRLIEPFAGSAALSIYMAYHHIIHQFILNDINAPLIHLWDSILSDPIRLIKTYTLLWHNQHGRERRYYDLIHTRFNQTHAPYYLLYLLARCVKASVRYNADGRFNQSPDNRRKGKHPETMGREIMALHQLLHNKTRLYSQDYVRVLQLATPDDVVYLDPPYARLAQKRTSRYLQTIDEARFLKQLEWLNDKHIPFILSYDGRTGQNQFHRQLPETLNLTYVELEAGRSSQQTLLGRNEITYESLYLSPSLIQKLDSTLIPTPSPRQLPLFEEIA